MDEKLNLSSLGGREREIYLKGRVSSIPFLEEDSAIVLLSLFKHRNELERNIGKFHEAEKYHRYCCVTDQGILYSQGEKPDQADLSSPPSSSSIFSPDLAPPSLALYRRIPEFRIRDATLTLYQQ